LRASALERINELETRLTEAEEARALEAAAARRLRERLAENTEELDAATLALDQARREAREALTLLAAARQARRELEASGSRLEDRLAEARARIEDQRKELTAAERAKAERDALLRAAEAKLTETDKQTLEKQRRVEQLNQQVGELRKQLGALQALLDDAQERDRKARVQIAELGEQLNAALAQKVSDLARVRSVFFEKMDKVLGGREDIQRVGDRFVFQSEVLFDPASAELGPEGRAELATLAEVLRTVSAEAPDELDWILRVDGHTDKRPLSGAGQYRNNWELSQARALSVVEYLIEEEGVPPGRLAAAGFGEHQPVAEGDSVEALARNRRIEFKFTER